MVDPSNIAVMEATVRAVHLSPKVPVICMPFPTLESVPLSPPHDHPSDCKGQQRYESVEDFLSQVLEKQGGVIPQLMRPASLTTFMKV